MSLEVSAPGSRPRQNSVGSRFGAVVLVSFLTQGGLLPAPAPAQDAAETETVDASSQDSAGYLYGIVELRSKSYEGRLTLGRGDGFWNESVDSYKEKRPFLRIMPAEARLKTVEMEVFGRTVTKTEKKRSRRGFSAPYGVIDRIEVHSHAWSSLLMRDGTEVELSGGRDLSSRVVVHGADGGEIKVPWRRILRIRFLPVPADFPVELRRLYAEVQGTRGTFEGFLQWDRDERFDAETLDGDPVGGGEERNIRFGDISSIEKIDSDSSRVTLKSGEVLELEGSNDVNDQIRGIWVHDKTWGRVGLDWDAFESLELVDAPSSGPSYDSFEVPGPLRGSVQAAGREHRGRIIFDVDEQWGWETLDGDADGVTYAVPFARIRSIERRSETETCLVTLWDGRQVELGDGNDVGDGNDGIVVVSDDGATSYLLWSEVTLLTFEPADESVVEADEEPAVGER